MSRSDRALRLLWSALAWLFLGAAVALAQGAGDTIAAGSWAFDALGLVYRDAGMVPAPIVAPMPRSELRTLLDAVDRQSLSPNATELYDRLEALCPSAGSSASPRLRAGLSAGFDARYRSDESIAYSGEAADRPSLVKIPLAFDLGDYATGFADLELREGYWASILPSSALDGDRNWTNIPDHYNYFDVSIPRRAGLSVGAEGWNFIIARDRVDMGAADLGATTVSRSLDRVDFARLSFVSGAFAWRSMIIELQPLAVTLETDDGTTASSIQRYIYLHRADMKPFSSLTIGFTEGVMVAQPLELRFLNPLVSFHALSSWKNYGDGDDSVGSLLGLDLGWTPFRGTRVYGQCAVNQIKTPFPSEAGSLQPDAYAFLGGLEWSAPMREGFFGLKLEGYYAAPWFGTLYGREWSFLSLRRELVAPDGYVNKGDLLAWVGSPYGRDAAVGKLEASYTSPGAWAYGLEYRFAALGENNLDLDSGLKWDGDWYYEDWQLDKENSEISAPSGTAILEQSLTLKGALTSGRWTFGASAALKLRLNEDHVKGRTAQGLETTLSVQREIF